MVITDGVLVDVSFGTWAVKVTPAHDPNDFECGKHNNLEFICAITKGGHHDRFYGGRTAISGSWGMTCGVTATSREDESLRSLTRRFEAAFLEDLDALNVVRADGYPRATEHISESVQMVQDLEEAGLAYESNGSWYFRVGKKEGYGQRYGLLGWKCAAGHA